MYHSTALGLPIEKLNVVVVEDSRPMQEVMRSILSSLRLERVRVFANADEALKAMAVEPPNLIITDWRMQPLSGYNLLKIVRHKSMMPLCFVPVIMVSGHATPSIVDKAFRGGAQQFLVKPISPAAVLSRIEMVLRDERTFQLDGDHYVINGVGEKLDRADERNSLAKQIHLDRLVEFRILKQAEKKAEKAPAEIEEKPKSEETDAPPFYRPGSLKARAVAKLASGSGKGTSRPSLPSWQVKSSITAPSAARSRAREAAREAASNPKDDFTMEL